MFVGNVVKMTGLAVVFNVVKITGLVVVVNIAKTTSSMVVVNEVEMTDLLVVVNVVKMAVSVLVGTINDVEKAVKTRHFMYVIRHLLSPMTRNHSNILYFCPQRATTD